MGQMLVPLLMHEKGRNIQGQLRLERWILSCSKLMNSATERETGRFKEKNSG